MNTVPVLIKATPQLCGIALKQYLKLCGIALRDGLLEGTVRFFSEKL